MAIKTLTLNVPDPLYSRLQERAQQANRTVEAEVLDVVATAVPLGDGLPAELEQAIQPLDALDDASLWKIARQRLPEASASRLESLHLKQQREGLDEAEKQELAVLLNEYEKAMLLRARAAALVNGGRETNHLARESRLGFLKG